MTKKGKLANQARTDESGSNSGQLTKPDLTTLQGAKKGTDGQLDAMIESFYDGVWIVDPKGFVLNANKVALSLHGLKAEEIVGWHITELINRDIIDRSSTMEVLRTKKQVHMLQYLAKSKKYLLVTATPILDGAGDIAQVVVTDRDMTELKDMWEHLDQMLKLQGDSHKEQFKKGMLELKGTRIVARSEAMRKVLEIALRLGQLSVTNILLLGESGTGKGLLAKFIHENSPRNSGPFIQTNCAALPETLVEMELFGYEKGAFTGSKPTGKVGLFELAQEGTIFLDEIGELPPSVQAKLLKCIDEREIMPLGGLKTKKIRCSIITATNRDLEDLVRRRFFREDLYYRLNSFNIQVPPLRERPADVVELVKNFLFTYNKTYKTEKRISMSTIERLKNYRLPGNIRELENLIRNAVVVSDGNTLDEYIQSYIDGKRTKEMVYSTEEAHGLDKRLRDKLLAAEINALKEALTLGKSTREIARILGISQPTVVRKLRKHHLPILKADQPS